MLNVGLMPSIEPDLLSGIATTVSDIAMIVDASGRIGAAATNPEHQGFGDVSDWVGRNIASILTGGSQVKLLDRIGIALKRADHGDWSSQTWAEVIHRQADGTTVPVRYSIFGLRTEKQVLLLGKDQRPLVELQQQLITAQVALERDFETQREMDTRYRLVMETTRDAIVLVSVATRRVIDVNRAAADLLGAARHDLTGADIAQEFEGRKQGEFVEAAVIAAGTERSSPIEVQARRSQKRLMLVPRVFRAAGERLLMLRLDDTTSETIDVVDPLASNLRQLFYQGIDGIVFTDKEGVILSASESFLNLTDAPTLSSVRGRSLADFLARGSVDLKVLLDNARRAGHLRLYSTRLTTDFRGQIAVEISATWLDERTHPVMALVVRDASRSDTLRSGISTADNNMRNVMDLVGSSSLKDIVAETTNVVEKICIETAVELTRNNRVAAAEMLGLSRQSLYVKLRKYGLLNRDDE